MAIETYGANGITVQARVWYERGLLYRAIPNFVHALPIWHKRASIPVRGGNVINWRRLELAVAATASLTEGTPPADTQITYTSVNATPSQYGQVVKISDLAETQSIDPVVMDTVEMLGDVLANTLDLIARNVMLAGTTVQFASTGTSRQNVSSGMFLRYADIRAAVATLERNNARRLDINGQRVFASIIHPDTKKDIFADSDILSAMQRAAPRDADNPIWSGKLPNIAGVNFTETTNARIFSSAGLSGMDVYGSIFFGKEAFGIVDYAAHPVRVMVVPRTALTKTDPLEQYGIVGWKASFVCVRLNENFVVRVEHGTTKSLAA